MSPHLSLLAYQPSGPNFTFAYQRWPSACKASATAMAFKFKGGVHLESSLREQKDHATLFQRTMFPVESGVECPLPKYEDHRLNVYRQTFQS